MTKQKKIAMDELKDMYVELGAHGERLIDMYNDIVTHILGNELNINELFEYDEFLDTIITMANIHEGTKSDHDFVTNNLVRVEDDLLN